MASVTLPNIGIQAGFVAAESGWDVKMNKNLRLLDALIQARVVDKDLNAPPGSPASGAVYIVGPAGSGAWAGHSNEIAVWQVGSDLTSAWMFVSPLEGWRFYVVDESVYYRYSFAGWVQDGNPAVQSTVTSSPITPTFAQDLFKVTALANALTINAPTGTAIDGKRLVIRLKDNGTARALTWNAIFRQMNVAIPTTTVAGKTLYLTWQYNSEDTKWDLVSVAQQA